MVELSSLVPQAFFNGAGSAGPRRLVMIGGTAIAMIAAVAVASMIGHKTPEPSRAAPLPNINRLPGGLNSNPEQEALARVDGQEKAAKALDGSKSFTPPMAPSRPYSPPPVVKAPSPASPPAPARAAGMPPPAAPIHFEAPAPAAPAARPVVQAAADGPGVQSLRDQINRLFQGYEGGPPRTEMVIDGGVQPAAPSGAGGVTHAAEGQPAAAQSERQSPRHVLIPGGRGIYAHTILAVSSDSGGPIVLQADSGPIAGDRMMGSFASKEDRLVVTVHTLIHDGESVGVSGLVIAPDSMETTVASSVDEHYASRLVLPVAAAFVQGLGQSIATSNTTSQVGALGTVSGFTHLDLAQQAGVGLGVAGAKVGQFLAEAAPKGPTVNLASNVNVGVMFLADVAVTK
jgi:intracellular multiplication protein IcmE